METKSKPSAKKQAPAAMATKSKRAKVDSRKSSDEVGDDQQAVIARLQSELEVERKSNKQLRREKAVEVQQVRETEQNRSSAAQKELATRLHQEKQKELEATRESLRCRQEAEIVKAIKQKDLEIKRLQRDLLRCQDELKEEIAKRGLSTSARSAFELERAKLLQEIKELTSAKKQLEDALRAASDAEKRKDLEIRQMQENCKLEVAKVEKEAGMEVRKLLEELKSKDHLLAQMDRNQYPDRSQALRQHIANQSVGEIRNLSKELEVKKQEIGAITTTTPTTPGLQSIGWQKKIYELEKQIRAASGLNHAFIEKNKEFSTINNNLEGKIKTLTEENKELNCELTSAKAEMKKMNEFFSGSNMESLNKQLERLRKLIKDQELIIAQLRFDCWEKDRQMKLKARANQPKKAVRFLLPGETVPLAPGFDVDDVIGDGHNGDDSFGDDSADSASVDSSSSDATMTELSSQPSLSDINLTDDDRELMEPSALLENVEKDYELLMKEHLTLEQSYASLLHSYSVRVDGEQPPEDWKIERESLNLAIYALEQKVRRCEENEELLRIKLEQITEEKEELEFKVLEHQECSEMVGEDGARSGQEHDAEILKKNEELASEVTQLQKKLEKFESAVKAPERHVGLQCDRLSENPPAKIAVTKPDCLELSAKSLLDDIENDSGIEAALSTSTSSGFDETSSEAEEPALANDPHPPANPDEPVANVTLKGENDDKKEKRMEEMGTIIKNFESMEVTWKATVDKLERQLHQSFLRERIIRDQIALVEEEKNRRINTLQGQIDLLEDNESRLSDTIVALENVALGVEDIHGGMASNIAMADELDRDVEELDRRRKQLREEVEQLVEAGRILGQVKLRIAGHVKSGNSLEIPDETAACPSTTPPDDVEVVSLVDVVEKALQSSIMRLENVDHQLGEESRKEKEIGQRIRKLETDTSKGTANERKPLNTLQVRKAVAECSQVVSNFAVEELQSDLRELRSLLIRLKAVISVDEMENRSGSELDGSSPFSLSKSKEARARLHLDLMLDGSKVADDWLAMTPPSVKITSEFGERDNDATEFQLRQKVDELEKDCDRLQKFAHEEEQVIRDMHFQNLELRNSEKNLQHMVERLESSEEQMHGKMEEMAEEMENLQVQVKQLETRERLAKSQVTKHQESEAELEERLEQTIEEMQNGKQKMERKIMELENDKKSLIRKTEEQADRIGDLEGLSGSLKQRIKNLETSESSLRQEMRKMEAELSSAAGQLSELEQQKESLVQQLQDLEKEKSKLLFEIADLTMDSNKQGHKITLLNQEIGKLRESLVGKGEVIACLQTKLEEATGMLEGLRMKLAACETAENGLIQSHELDASVNENKQSVTEIKKQGCEALTCQQSTQTSFERLKAKIVIEKATSGFRDTLLSLGERHPRILREFLSASLLPLLDSRESLSGDSAIPEEMMKRFISSLRVEIPCGPSARLSNGNHLESLDGNGKEEKHWTEVEDLDVVCDVQRAENSTNWKEIEGRMGFNTDDLALTIEFRDTVEVEIEDHANLSRINKGNQLDDGSNKSVPPPLPDSSPPRVAPELCIAGELAEESADEASDIDDEDDGAVPLGDSVAPSWKVSYCVPSEQSDLLVPSQQLRPSSGISHAEPIASLDSRFERARSVDRDYFPLSRNAFHGSELRRMVTGSLESITDSGMDSMRQGTMVIPEEASRQKTRNSFEDKRLLKDQAIQTNGRELHEPVIVLKTQLEEREKELVAKSNEMDLLSQELRRWQREAVSAGEERTRLSALLGCALKDLKVVQESNGGGPEVKSLTTAAMLAKIQKSPLGLPSWVLSFGTEKMRPVSHIPVRHSSVNDRDFAVKCQPSTALRPTSLHSSDQRQSSGSSSTDAAPHSDSDSGSSYASPSQDRKSVSYLPRPVNQPGPSSPSVGTSSRKEADRLFRQSFDSTRNSQSRQSASSSPSSLSSSPSQSGPEPVSDGLKCLQAVEPATSRGEGATVL